MAGEDGGMIRTFINVSEFYKKKVFNAFIESGVHGEIWGNITYAVAMYKSEGEHHCMVVQNVNLETHAEHVIIENFENLLQSKKLDPPKIKLFLNYAPCAICCPAIITFLNTAGSDLEVEIVFSAFYRVNRPSCAGRSVCTGKHPVDEKYHKQRVDGLRELYNKKEQVVLRTIRGEDWKVLATALFDRNEKDKYLEENFKQLMGEDHS